MSDGDDFLAHTTFRAFYDTVLTVKGKGGIAEVTVSELGDIASDLARDDVLRVRMGANKPSIWPTFHQTWHALAERVASDESDMSTRSLVTSFARFTRNLVAAVPVNQQNAFASEPCLRRILHVYSSWSATQDPQSYAVTRMMVQTLSNIVTSNDALMTRLWDTYLKLPEEQVVLIRLLGLPDTRTILSLLVFLANCVHENNQRRALLVETRVGARLCITLLDRMATLYDAEISSDEGKAFNYGYHFFTHLFDGGFTPKLYTNLRVPDEIIAPHQTTLLKLLDSYLQSSHSLTALVDMCPMLTTCFFEFCTFSTEAVNKSVGTGSRDKTASPDDHMPGQGVLDLFLPKACEALVLVTQCLVSAMLKFEESHIKENSRENLSKHIREAVSPHGQDIAVCAIELLRILNIFLPRIHFGKPVLPSWAVQDFPGTTDPTGFSCVKRDLVRLLGVLCHKDRKIQDSIRNCEGVTVVMNMCVVDERNPYLREHAIFTLHNLLEDNEENQKVMNNIQPSERWDQDGM